MKSGPTLKGCTRRPRSFRAARSASVTVVMPTPLCVPAMTSLGKFIPCANLIGKLHSGKNRSDRRAKEEHLLVVLIEEVINTTKNLPLFRHIIGRGHIHHVEGRHFLSVIHVVHPSAEKPIVYIHPKRIKRMIAEARTGLIDRPL